ncbi:2-isopropylmalate synthase, partial [Striga asiatica]
MSSGSSSRTTTPQPLMCFHDLEAKMQTSNTDKNPAWSQALQPLARVKIRVPKKSVTVVGPTAPIGQADVVIEHHHQIILPELVHHGPVELHHLQAHGPRVVSREARFCGRQAYVAHVNRTQLNPFPAICLAIWARGFFSSPSAIMGCKCETQLAHANFTRSPVARSTIHRELVKRGAELENENISRKITRIIASAVMPPIFFSIFFW